MSNIVLRNTIISIILIIALFIIVLLRDQSPYGKNQSSFAAVPKNGITRIELSDNKNNLVLSKEGDTWSVNGTGESRKSAILFLIRILTEMRIKSPVTPDMFSGEIIQTGISPVRVRVFENNRLLKSFLVYKTGSNPHGNIMKMSERSKPFIVYVPGYDADIGSAFITSELFWQPFNIFNLLPSEISSVTLENLADTASSFAITSMKGTFTLSDTRRHLPGLDSSRIKRYLSYFTRVPFENWAFDMTDEARDKIMSQNPVYRITVKNTAGEEIVLTMWERYDGQTGAKDSDRLLGKSNTSDEFFIIRYFDIDPLLKKRSYFCQ
ncbi:MAG: hypothetical protein A2V64_02900 [Bacteroidetes bacterium RBG_13_43_22]|nr:MAG: hypothetical protein A2V64_02900 [Bacteroidetes bacterium RBG_13_43_22]